MSNSDHHHVSELPPWDKRLYVVVLFAIIVLACYKPEYAGIVIGLGALYSEARHIRIILSRKKDPYE